VGKEKCGECFLKKTKFREEMKHNEKSQSIQDHYVGGRIKVFFKKSVKPKGKGIIKIKTCKPRVELKLNFNNALNLWAFTQHR
jgi:hypothetical protein